MKTEKNIYPSGDFGIWIIIYIEFITFGAFFIGFAISRIFELELFNASQELLNKNLGFINTIILISSSFFVALAVNLVKNNESNKKASLYLLISIILAICFLLIKIIEYKNKYAQGIDLSTNTFFMFYFLLTMFHSLHVIFGMIILFNLYKNTSNNIYSSSNYLGLESGALYWHMVDLLWIIIFPLIYILK